MDEIRVSNIARYTSNFTPSTTAFSNDSNTKLLLHCDGTHGSTTFTDSSSSAHTVSVTGQTRILAPKIGTGAYRNNRSGNGLMVPSANCPWAEFGTGDFTVEAWVSLDDITTDNQQFFTHRNSVNSGDWVFWWDASQGLSFSGSNDTLQQGGTTGWANNTWVHVAASRAFGINRLFVNGTLVATNTSATQDYNATATLFIASYSTGTGGFSTNSGALEGFMDEARITPGKALYTGNFTPSTTAYSSDANTKLLLHCDGSDGGTTFTDSGATTHTMTANGNVHTDTTIKKIGTAAAQFDGTGDYISTPNHADFNFGSGDFTFEGWFYTTDTTDQVLFSQYQDASNRWYLRLDNRAAQQGIGFYNHNGSIDVEAADHTWPGVNQWVHMAFVRYSGVISIYINGELIKLKTNNSPNGSFANNTGTLRIGDYNGGSNYSGYMDEIRISNSARYTANFTPSTTAYTDNIDTRLLMHFDGGGPGTAGSDTNVGQGQYYHDSSTNAIFYEDNLPKYKSYINFDGSGDYLTATGTSTPTDRGFDFITGPFAIEFWFWVKDSNAHTALVNSANYYVNGFNGNWAFDCYQEDVRFNMYNGTGSVGSVDSTGGKIECGVWNHVAFCRDGSGNSRIFINGELSSSVSTVLNGESLTDGSYGVEFGGNISYAGPGDLNGGMDNIRISNSARYTSAFTKPTDRLTSDADTVFLLNSDFTDGGLGADHSGNYNLFTPNNLGTEDMVEDSPTNNFATLNPLETRGTITLSEGNLKGITGAGYSETRGTIAIPQSGKWYWEFCMLHSTSFMIGVIDYQHLGSGDFYSSNKAVLYSSGLGTHYNFSSVSANDWGARWTAGDIMGVAFNRDDNQITFYKNGSAQPTLTIAGTADERARLIPLIGTGTGGTAGGQINFGQDSSFSGNKTAQGNQDGNDKGDFFYTPPTGYLALCTDNLDTPSIADPTDHFNTVLYTGNGGTQSITGVGFAPDLFWNKNRTGTYQHMLYNTISGATKYLSSGETDAEATDANSLTSFNSDGVTLGSSASSNATSVTSVGWNWKAGGAASSNSDGSITSSVSANTTAGFSIVKWTGTGSNATVGHGLSQAPELLINKSLGSTHNWAIQSIRFVDASDTNILYVNTDAGEADDTNVFQAAPTA